MKYRITTTALTVFFVFAGCLGSFEPPTGFTQQDTVESQPDVVVEHDTTPTVGIDTAVVEEDISSTDTAVQTDTAVVVAPFVCSKETQSEDCNDNNACTFDVCDVEHNKCAHPVVDDFDLGVQCCNDAGECGTGQYCNQFGADPATGVDLGYPICANPCQSHEECGEGALCDLETRECHPHFCKSDDDCHNYDYCWEGTICSLVVCPRHGHDQQCVVSAEIVDHWCDEVDVEDGTPCEDDNVCTLNSVCFNGGCNAALWVNCDDGKDCTNDYCDPASGGCVSEPLDTAQCLSP